MPDSAIEFEIPDDILENWQEIANCLAEIIQIPAALIMRYTDPYIEVFVSSQSKGNPYHPGDRETLFGSGLFCERVINTQEKLLVPDALADIHWKNNPDVKLNMISYLGFPILYPDKKPFGTLCVLDNKANTYSKTTEKLMLNFLNLIESHLKLISANLKLSDQNKQIEEAKKKLSETIHLYEDLTSRIPVGVYVMRINKVGERRFEFISTPMCEILGIRAEDALNDAAVVHNTIHPDDRPGLDALDKVAANTLQPFFWEGRYIVRGETRWERVQSTPIQVSEDESLWNGIIVDITDEIAEQNLLKEQAYTDELTGLPNRRKFIEMGEKFLKGPKMGGTSFVVAIVDIDHFKVVNDTYGHAAGDSLLKEFGRLAKSCFRLSDILGRLGGDEFGIVLTQTSSRDAMNTLQRFQLAVAGKTIHQQETPITVTISCGMCTFSSPEDTFMQLLNKADQALYRAKEQGRNQVVVF